MAGRGSGAGAVDLALSLEQPPLEALFVRFELENPLPELDALQLGVLVAPGHGLLRGDPPEREASAGRDEHDGEGFGDSAHQVAFSDIASVRKRRAVISCFLASCLHLPAGARADDWVGLDKALHFSVSAGLGGAGYGVAVFVSERRWVRALYGAGFSLTLGGAKEIYDATGAGTPSEKDLVWDLFGTLVGVSVAYLVDWLVTQEPTETSFSPPDQQLFVSGAITCLRSSRQ